MAERAKQGLRNAGVGRAALTLRKCEPELASRGIIPSRLAHKIVIIFTLRLCRFGARRITLLAAVVSGLVRGDQK